MASYKPQIVTVLQIAHLCVFLIGVFIVVILHIYTQNFWDFLRLPTFLKSIDDFLNQAYPASLHIYQSILIFSMIITFIDALGLFFYKSKSWKIASDLTSFLGLLIIWPVALFFIFTIATAKNMSTLTIQTIYTYFGLSMLIFILDLVTWFVDEQALIRPFRRKSGRLIE